MQIRVDTDRCIGAGQCALTAPAVFDQDDAGFVVLLQVTPAADDVADAVEAADRCPATAISLSDSPGS